MNNNPENTMPITNPESLTDRAMLVSITISMPSNSKQDKDSTEEVTSSHQASDGAARVNKTLFDKEAVKTFRQPATAARQAVTEATLPWDQKGVRILLAANYFKLVKEVEIQERAFWTAVERFKKHLDNHIQEARQQLGTLFREEDYPSVEELEAQFDFQLNFTAITDPKDWRVNLGAEEEAAITKRIEERTTAAISKAAQEPWNRVRAAAAALATRLEVRCEQTQDPDFQGRPTPLKNALLDNLSGLVTALPGLNITNDPQLEAIGKEIEQLLQGHEMETLKASPEAQKELAGGVRELEDKVNQYAGLM